MIIESVYRDEVVNFSNKEIKFDKNGKAEVESKLGKSIVEDFPSMVWEFGKKPKEEVKKEPEDFLIVSELREKVFKLENMLKEKSSELKRVKEAEKIWREKFEETQKSNSFKIPEGFEELYDEMMKKTFKELSKWVLETLKKKPESIKGITSKNGLAQFVFDNMK